MFRAPRWILVTLVAVLVSTPAAIAYAAGVSQRSAPTATRTVLAQLVDPTGAEGRTLALSRVKIPAHTALSLHRHPGVQIAYIQRGTLTYTVKKGVVPVYRGAADQKPVVVRRIGAGETGPVHAGEWVVERPRNVHFGANNGDKPVVILISHNGAPAAIPVTE